MLIGAVRLCRIWNFRYFPSGTIVVSSIEDGLFVLQLGTIQTLSPTPSPTACEDTFVYPPSQTMEACAATVDGTLARFTKQCNRKPAFASSYLDKEDDLSATACADLCLSRFSCRSFTHRESDGKCQLYAKICKDDLDAYGGGNSGI